MNIPSPAAVKKLTDERKAREAEQASSLANAKEANKNPESSEKRDSSTSRSYRKAKVSQDRSSHPSMKSTRTNTTSPVDGRKGTKSTSTTTRKNSGTKSTQIDPSKSKKAFVRPDHLTQRPLRDNEALQSLRKELEKPARGQFKRAYKTNARQSGKGLQTKKENS